MTHFGTSTNEQHIYVSSLTQTTRVDVGCSCIWNINHILAVLLKKMMKNKYIKFTYKILFFLPLDIILN